MQCHPESRLVIPHAHESHLIRLRHPIVKYDAPPDPIEVTVAWHPLNPYIINLRHLARGMHECVRQFSIIGQQQ